MEKRIEKLIEETINILGFDLVKITIGGSLSKVLEILIEKKDGGKVQVGDCQLVSRNISAILDVEDIVTGKYFLEVSSPGIERPLVKPQDFEKFAGREIKIRLKKAVEGNFSFRGNLIGLSDGCVKLRSKDLVLSFDCDNIKSAKLVLTDELFRALLNKKEI